MGINCVLLCRRYAHVLFCRVAECGILKVFMYIMPMERISPRLYIFKECRSLHVEWWQCPPFLILVIGTFIISAMMATYFLASRYYVEEPEFTALVVIFVTLYLLVMGALLIKGFSRIAETDRLKSEFIAIASHELRSPLSIFKWTLDLLARTVAGGGNPKEIENFLATLQSASEDMILVVNSILEISRIESERLVLRHDLFSLNELTNETLKKFERYAKACNVRFKFSPALSLPNVVGDKERMRMVLKTLVDNAIRYTSSSGVITVTIEPVPGMVAWKIKDEGTGIPLAEQRYIFGKFFRAKNIIGQQPRGSGLGLYIAKAIIEASGGTMGFRSQEGEGSEFYFTFPLRAPNNQDTRPFLSATH
ncbi:MAG: multi-sensor signal transduction histidine kinase [Parcubacteria group bacterium Gr01-1014_33]|nr:MAG: multi-sensor signal transduction histidine kinase [Parcubacteria group bacterium Gr01-1014_33]